MKVNVGDKIRIINIVCAPSYAGRQGVVTRVWDDGQISGTWGGLTINPYVDVIEIVES